MLAFLGEIGTGELVLILLIALLFFGNRLPNVARSLGLSINEFKKGVKEGEADNAPKPPAATPPNDNHPGTPQK